MRRVLVVSGGVEAVPGIERVERLGVEVVVSDGNPTAPGFALADECIVASTYDVAATCVAAAAAHARRPIHGVLSIAADVPFTVASVARRLGLPGLSLDTARLAIDKLAMKERLRTAGVPVPWCAPADSPTALARIVETRRSTLVLKPVDSRGARGVLRLDGSVDLDWAYATAVRHSPSARAMVEEFVRGPQLSSESMIWQGRAWTAGLSDRNYEHLQRLAPFVIENGGCQPTAHLSDLLPAVDELVLRAARAIGLERGVLKGDLVLDPQRGLVVIEVAPRLSGGWLATDQIPLSTGVDLVQAQAKVALGDELTADELTPRRWDPVAVRYFFPRPGRLVAVHGAAELTELPWVQRVVLFAQAGDELAPASDHTRRAGLVITTGPTRAEAVRRAEYAVASVRFEVEPARSAA
jgi:biotin carboxylase